MKTIIEAERYIKENKDRIHTEYRLHFHFMPPVGWMNDPNGFSIYEKEYHLFYQYNPYSSEWNTMHWGHAVTKDFIRWEDRPVALAPDRAYDQDGCFSGSAIEVDGQHCLFYTGVRQEKNHCLQQQAMAVSIDGISYEKAAENPVIADAALPEEIISGEFRDPYLFRGKNGWYYAVCAAMDETRMGRLLLYNSRDLYKWELKGDMITPDPTLGKMLECPCLIHIEDQDLMILSMVEHKPEMDSFWTVNSTSYAVGEFSETIGKFCGFDAYREIDHGFDFYAAQCLKAEDGRVIMIAWMQNWGVTVPTHDMRHGWAGAMTIPRELNIENGYLIQNPVREIERYWLDEIVYEDIKVIGEWMSLEGVQGKHYDLELTVDLARADRFWIEIFAGETERTVFSYEKKTQIMTFDRSKSGWPIIAKSRNSADRREAHIELGGKKELQIRLLLDTCSCEAFFQYGKVTMTNTVFPLKNSEKIRFKAQGSARISKLRGHAM